MPAISASHRCAADSVSVSSTVCRSKVERLITLSTSAVAVCCASKARSRRVFSIAMTACAAKLLTSSILLIGKGADFLAIDVDRTDQLVFFEHRDVDKSPGASQFEETGANGIALVDRLGLDIGNLSRLLRRHHASERGPRYGTQEQVFSSLLDIRRWRIMVGDKAEGLSFAEIECRKFGPA